MNRGSANGHELEVGCHYDDLDRIYRLIWGEGLHHGIWTEGTRTTSEATDRMTQFVGCRLGLRPGERLWDVGCGCGRMMADLAEKFGVKAGGVTISSKQWENAVPGVEVQLGDWLENRLRDSTFDAVMAVESLEHMSDPRRAVTEMARVVKTGGRVVLGCWMACDAPLEWEKRMLIDPIRRDGLLKGMADERAVREWLDAAGLELIQVDDLSRQVEKTWPDCLWRSYRMAITSREMRRMLYSNPRRSVRMAFTLKRIWMAYVLGAMRYVVFTARRRD